MLQIGRKERQMLKAWRTPDGQVLKALGADMDENDMEGDGGTLMSAVQLMEGQKKQLDELLQEKNRSIGDLPGRVEILEHKINTGGA